MSFRFHRFSFISRAQWKSMKTKTQKIETSSKRIWVEFTSLVVAGLVLWEHFPIKSRLLLIIQKKYLTDKVGSQP
jgi:hypothetical protein